MSHQPVAPRPRPSGASARRSDPVSAPRWSVVVPAVGTVDRERLLDVVEALDGQTIREPVEVIVVDRRRDAVSDRLRARWPEVRVLEVEADTPLVRMRWLGARAAAGAFVVLTEDHCVPDPGWLEAFARAWEHAPAETAAVGGAVVNGVTARAFDVANVLCEYGAVLAPLEPGPAAAVAGMNVSYRRDDLLAADPDLAASSFWETTLHPAWRARGRVLLVAPDALVTHVKRFEVGHFLQQRYLYSRAFAARRVLSRAWPVRVLYGAAAWLLPPLLLARLARVLLARRGTRADLLRCSPWLCVFMLPWAAGECVGAWLGAGSAPSRIE